jgi:hypothetical protein
MRSAPFSASANTAIRARRAVRSCASAMAFASYGGEGAEGVSFFVTALAAAGFDLPRVFIASLRESII